ncbi:MAG: hypothetical protein D6746_06115 [Bacteroidetes bacterium]|nr:MAG: hypothetical protein D6746_06115 [Bacteroidota bacterium]
MDTKPYRMAVVVALVAAVLLLWVSQGVGIIGADGDPANRMYFGVLAVGLIGAVLAWLRPRGMARALVATAVAQGAVTVVALAGGMGRPWSGPLEGVLLNGFFIALFLVSAWLFRQAARDEEAARAKASASEETEGGENTAGTSEPA